MEPPSRYWPDGRPVGGENGYPPEYREWTVECQCRHVARLASQARTAGARGAILREWQQKLPGVTRERVAEIWRQGVPMPTTRGNR